MIGGRPSWSIARCLMTGSRVWRQLAVRGASNRLGSAELTVHAEQLCLKIAGESGPCTLNARCVVDARGRSTVSSGNRILLGPHTHAIWTEVGAGILAEEARIEALEVAWLWGSPLANGNYRIMAFVDLGDLCAVENREQHFRRLLAGSLLFESAAQEPFVSPLSERASTPSVEAEAWRARIVAIGERAVALDPLSSSGVEQAMRSALHAAIAVNTVLDCPEAEDFARNYYVARLLESAANHAVMTAGHYLQAWPSARHRFWQDRSSIPTPVAGSDTNEIEFRLAQLIERSQTERSKPVNDRPAPRLSDTVHLSPLIQFVSTPCVENDRVISRLAVTHATLPRPAAYVCGIELVPLLKRIPSACPVGNLITSWSETFPRGPRSRFSNG